MEVEDVGRYSLTFDYGDDKVDLSFVLTRWVHLKFHHKPIDVMFVLNSITGEFLKRVLNRKLSDEEWECLMKISQYRTRKAQDKYISMLAEGEKPKFYPISRTVNYDNVEEFLGNFPVEALTKERGSYVEWLVLYRKGAKTLVLYGHEYGGYWRSVDVPEDLLEAVWGADCAYIISPQGIYELEGNRWSRALAVYGFVKYGRTYKHEADLAKLYEILNEFGVKELAELVGVYALLSL